MHLKSNNSFSRVLASSVAALIATTSLNAIPKDPCEPPTPPVCCEEPRPGPFAFAYPFDLDLNCPKDFYVHVDGLLMQAKEDGLDFALNDSTKPDASTPVTNGQMVGFSSNNHDYDWNPGMRVGLGFYLDHDAWNFDFNWTWLNLTNYKNAKSTTALGALLPQWSLGIGTPTNQIGAEMSGKWDAHYNMFDISLGKAYYVSRYFIVNPHFGVRGGWIDQHFAVDMGGNSAVGNSRTIMHADNDFWGIGTRCGIDTDWVLGKGWCLFGNVAASMLFGKFDIDQNYTLPLLAAGTNVDGYNIDSHFYQNVPNFEIVLGIGWGAHFNKKRNHISLRAAYEFHEWWDQLNIRKFYSGSEGVIAAPAGVVGSGIYANEVVARGNLSLNGFSLRLQFDM